MIREFIRDYDYTKHLKLMAAVYIPLIAIDLTLGYVVCKKVSERLEDEELFEDL